MSHTISNLYEMAKTDAALEGQLQSAGSAGEVVKIAASRGLSVSMAEVESVAASMKEGPMSEAELTGVTGGVPNRCYCTMVTWLW